jgi:formylglycine-generating enzyme required for sulfatase activity
VIGRRLAAAVCAFLAVISVRAEAFPDPVTGMEFVFVKGGCYPMGDTFGDGNPDELPVHEVCVTDFRIGKYKVSQGEWVKVMGGNPSQFRKGGLYPVENVSWNDAQRFIGRLNKKTGRKYRLPTEAEWEYAARSGGKREKWAGTAEETELKEYGWFYTNSGRATHPLGGKRPNGLGLYDMTGNVWEWCSDWYKEKYYRSSPRNDPQGPPDGFFRSLRGGSWDTDARNVRASSRYWGIPDAGTGRRGFRLAHPAR